MKLALFLSFIACSIGISISADQIRKLPTKESREQRPLMMPVNRSNELLKALPAGFSCLLGIGTSLWCIKNAYEGFKASKSLIEDRFFAGLDILLAIVLLEFGILKGQACFESFRKAFMGYTATLY